MRISPCPNCGATTLYKSKDLSAGSGQGLNLLPGLGGVFTSEKFHVVLCKTCGLMRFFARHDALEKLSDAAAWTRV